MVVVIGLAIVSVTTSVLGPRILGNATDIIFSGVIGKQLPAGVTQAQVEAGLRASGQGQIADLLSGMTVTPGVGIDFGALAQILLILAAIFVVSSLFAWGQAYLMAGVTQRTVYRLRTDVDEKLGRLPLKYFDSHPRGDILSRVTNDIDNIGQTLQQSLTQLITSVLTVIGVLVMMLLISPELAVISLLAVPASVIVAAAHRQALAEAVRRAVEDHRLAQRARRGDAHRARHRDRLRPPEGGPGDVPGAEREALRRQLPGPVHLRHHPAGDELHRQPQLRRAWPSSAACGSPPGS